MVTAVSPVPISPQDLSVQVTRESLLVTAQITQGLMHSFDLNTDRNTECKTIYILDKAKSNCKYGKHQERGYFCKNKNKLKLLQV